MDGGVRVDGGERLVERRLIDVGGQNDLLHANADRFAALDGAALVGQIVRTFSDTYNTERGDDPTLRKCRGFALHAGDHRVDDRFAF